MENDEKKIPFSYGVSGSISKGENGLLSASENESQVHSLIDDILSESGLTLSQTDEVSGSITRRGTEGRLNDLEEILTLQNQEKNTLGIRYLTEDITEETDVPLPNNPDEIPLPAETSSTRPSSPTSSELISTDIESQLSMMLNRSNTIEIKGKDIKIHDSDKLFKSPILPPRPTKNFKMGRADRTLDRLRELNEQMQNEIDHKIDQIKRRKSEIQSRKIMIESRLGFLKYQEYYKNNFDYFKNGPSRQL